MDCQTRRGKRGGCAEYPAKRNALKGIRRFVKEASRGYNLPDTRALDFQIAVSEVAAKAIESSEDGDRLRVRVGEEQEFVVAEVTHPRHLKRPPYLPLPFEQDAGLPLMAALADQVAVTRPPEGGTTIRLAVKRETS